MTAQQRREKITDILQKATVPVTAGSFAQTLCVSRQLVVGDIALLRAAGAPILATPRGYVLESTAQDGILCTVACRHSAEAIADELYTVVDCGCAVLDVIVEHPVYGQLLGQLQIHSRYDADMFCDALCKNEAQPLCRLTGDVHLHTLRCPTEEHKTRVLQALSAKGYLTE